MLRTSRRRAFAGLAAAAGALAGTAAPAGAPQDLTQTVTFTNPSPNSGDEFGFSVAIEGNVAVVGARFDDAQGTNAGAAYIYRFDPDAGTWSFFQPLLANHVTGADQFGCAVDVSGDRIIVGSRFHDHPGTDGGSAFIYRFNGLAWDFETEIGPVNGPTLNAFGASVAIEGDVAVAGAPFDNLPVSGAGSVHVFRFDGAAWQFEQELTPAGIEANDVFGGRVDVSGGYIIAGADSDDGPGNGLPGAGAAYIYRYELLRRGRHARYPAAARGTSGRSSPRPMRRRPTTSGSGSRSTATSPWSAPGATRTPASRRARPTSSAAIRRATCGSSSRSSSRSRRSPTRSRGSSSP
jgi:hypothetical protein